MWTIYRTNTLIKMKIVSQYLRRVHCRHWLSLYWINNKILLSRNEYVFVQFGQQRGKKFDHKEYTNKERLGGKTCLVFIRDNDFTWSKMVSMDDAHSFLFIVNVKEMDFLFSFTYYFSPRPHPLCAFVDIYEVPIKSLIILPVSYTHLTLPTIYSV